MTSLCAGGNGADRGDLGVLEDGFGGSEDDGCRVTGVLEMMEVGFLGYWR